MCSKGVAKLILSTSNKQPRDAVSQALGVCVAGFGGRIMARQACEQDTSRHANGRGSVHEARRLVHNHEQRIEGWGRQGLQCIHALHTYGLPEVWWALQPRTQNGFRVQQKMTFW